VYTAGIIFFGYWKAITMYIKVPYSVPFALQLFAAVRGGRKGDEVEQGEWRGGR